MNNLKKRLTAWALALALVLPMLPTGVLGVSFEHAGGFAPVGSGSGGTYNPSTGEVAVTINWDSGYADNVTIMLVDSTLSLDVDTWKPPASSAEIETKQDAIDGYLTSEISAAKRPAWAVVQQINSAGNTTTFSGVTVAAINSARSASASSYTYNVVVMDNNNRTWVSDPITIAAASYTITFDPNGGTNTGTLASDNTVTTSGALGASFPSDEPTNSGYGFAGWYRSDGTTQVDGTTVFSADTTVYAKWRPAGTLSVSPNTKTISPLNAAGNQSFTLSNPSDSSSLIVLKRIDFVDNVSQSKGFTWTSDDLTISTAGSITQNVNCEIVGGNSVDVKLSWDAISNNKQGTNIYYVVYTDGTDNTEKRAPISVSMVLNAATVADVVLLNDDNVIADQVMYDTSNHTITVRNDVGVNQAVGTTKARITNVELTNNSSNYFSIDSAAFDYPISAGTSYGTATALEKGTTTSFVVKAASNTPDGATATAVVTYKTGSADSLVSSNATVAWNAAVTKTATITLIYKLPTLSSSPTRATFNSNGTVNIDLTETTGLVDAYIESVAITGAISGSLSSSGITSGSTITKGTTSATKLALTATGLTAANNGSNKAAVAVTYKASASATETKTLTIPVDVSLSGSTTYSVTFNAGSGSIPGGFTNPVTGVSSGTTVASIAPAATRAGYTLTGWQESSERSDGVTTNQVTSVTGDVTLYPIWTASDSGITISSHTDTTTFGTAYSNTFTPTLTSYAGDTPALSLVTTTAVDGLTASLSGGTITVSGTPTSTGNKVFTIRNTAGNGLTKDGTITITVNKATLAAPSITAVTDPSDNSVSPSTGGTVTVASGSGYVNGGTVIELYKDGSSTATQTWTYDGSATNQFIGLAAGSYTAKAVPATGYEGNYEASTATAASVIGNWVVTYDLNGGAGSIANAYVPKNGATTNNYTLAGAPSYSNATKTFSSWTVSGNSGGTTGTQSAGAPITVKADATVTAQWDNASYTLTYTAGDGATGSNQTVTGISAGTSQALLTTTPTGWSKGSKELVGWTISGINYYITAAPSVTVNSNLTATAIWADPITFTGGTISGTQGVSIDDNNYSASGGSGGGFTYSVSPGSGNGLTGATLASDAGVRINGTPTSASSTTFTLTATDKTTGKSATTTVTVTAGAALAVSATNPAGGTVGTAYSGSGTVTATGGKTAYAYFVGTAGTTSQLVDGLTLTINASDGTYTVTGTPEALSTVFTVGVKDADNTEKTTTVTVTAAKGTLTTPTITVTSDPSTDTATDGQITVNFPASNNYEAGDTVYLYNSGNVVVGTHTFAASETSHTFSDSGSGVTGGGLGAGSYYARVEPTIRTTTWDQSAQTSSVTIGVWTITYDKNGADDTNTSHDLGPVYVGKNATTKTHALLNNQWTYTNRSFVNWSVTGSGLSNATMAPASSFTVTSDTTVAAIWSGEHYTVTFTLNDGGAGTAKFSDGTTANKMLTTGDDNKLPSWPADPTRPGYTFTGWKTSGGETYTSSSSFSASTTLLAQWNVIQIKLQAPTMGSFDYGTDLSGYTWTWTVSDGTADWKFPGASGYTNVTVPSGGYFNIVNADNGNYVVTVNSSYLTTLPAGDYDFAVGVTSGNGTYAQAGTVRLTINKVNLTAPGLAETDTSMVGGNDGTVTVSAPATNNWPDDAQITLYDTDGTTPIGTGYPWAKTALPKTVSSLPKGTYTAKVHSPSGNYNGGVATITVNDPSTVTATYKVGPDGNGRNGTAGSKSDGDTQTPSTTGSTTVWLGTVFTPPTGFRFKEWKLVDNLYPSGTSVASGGSYAFQSPATLTAQWEPIPITLTPPANVTKAYGDAMGSEASRTWTVGNYNTTDWAITTGSPTNYDTTYFTIAKNTAGTGIVITEKTPGTTPVDTYNFTIQVTSTNTSSAVNTVAWTYTVTKKTLGAPTLVTTNDNSTVGGKDGEITASFTDLPHNTTITLYASDGSSPSTKGGIGTYTATVSGTGTYVFTGLPTGTGYYAVVSPNDTTKYESSGNSNAVEVKEPGAFGGTITVLLDGGAVPASGATGSFNNSSANVPDYITPKGDVTLRLYCAANSDVKASFAGGKDTGVWTYSGAASGKTYQVQYSLDSGGTWNDLGISVYNSSANATVNFWTVTAAAGTNAATATVACVASDVYLNGMEAQLQAAPNALVAAGTEADWTLSASAVKTGDTLTSNDDPVIVVTGATTATADYPAATYDGEVTVYVDGTQTDVVSIKLVPDTGSTKVNGTKTSTGTYTFALTAGTDYSNAEVVTQGAGSTQQTFTAALTAVPTIRYASDTSTHNARIDLYTVTKAVEPSVAGNAATVNGTNQVIAPAGAVLALAVTGKATNYAFDTWKHEEGTAGAATTNLVNPTDESTATYTVTAPTAGTGITLTAHFAGQPLLAFNPTSASKTILQDVHATGAGLSYHTGIRVQNVGTGDWDKDVKLVIKDSSATFDGTATTGSGVLAQALVLSSDTLSADIAAGAYKSFDLTLDRDNMSVGTYSATLWAYYEDSGTLVAIDSMDLSLLVLQPIAAVPDVNNFTWDTYTESVTVPSGLTDSVTINISLPTLDTVNPVIQVKMGSTYLSGSDYTVGAVSYTNPLEPKTSYVPVTLSKSGIKKLATALANSNSTMGTVSITCLRGAPEGTNHDATVTINLVDTMPGLTGVDFDTNVTNSGGTKYWTKGDSAPTYTLADTLLNASDVTYSWKVDGSVVSTSATYDPSGLAVGKVVTLEVTGTGVPYKTAKPTGGDYYKNTVTVSDQYTVAAPGLTLMVRTDSNTPQVTGTIGDTTTSSGFSGQYFISSSVADATKYRWDKWTIQSGAGSFTLAASTTESDRYSDIFTPSEATTLVANYLTIGHLTIGDGSAVTAGPNAGTGSAEYFETTVTSNGAGNAVQVYYTLEGTDAASFDLKGPANSGTVPGTAGTGTVMAPGDTQNVSVVPKAGSVSAGQSYTVKLVAHYLERTGDGTEKTAEQTIVYGVPTVDYVITLKQPANGSISGSWNTTTVTASDQTPATGNMDLHVTAGDPVALAATPAAGYKFLTWDKDTSNTTDTFVSATDAATFYGPVTGAETLTGTFRAVTDLSETHTVDATTATFSQISAAAYQVLSGTVSNAGALGADVKYELTGTDSASFEITAPASLPGTGIKAIAGATGTTPATESFVVKAKQNLARGTYTANLVITEQTADSDDTMNGVQTWTIPITFTVTGFDAKVKVKLDANYKDSETVMLVPQVVGASAIQLTAPTGHEYVFTDLDSTKTYDVYVNSTKTDKTVAVDDTSTVGVAENEAEVIFYTIDLSTVPTGLDNQPTATGTSATFGTDKGFLAGSDVTVTAAPTGTYSATNYKFDRWVSADTSTLKTGAVTDLSVVIESASGMKAKANYLVPFTIQYYKKDNTTVLFTDPMGHIETETNVALLGTGENKPGYTFEGWGTTANPTAHLTNPVPLGSILSALAVSGVVKLYPHYEPITAIFPAINDTLKYGDVYSKSAAPTNLSGVVTGYSILSGALPDGLALNPTTGEISGQPYRLGTFTFKVRATDGTSTWESDSMTIEVGKATPVITSAVALASADVGDQYNTVGYKATVEAPRYNGTGWETLTLTDITITAGTASKADTNGTLTVQNDTTAFSTSPTEAVTLEWTPGTATDGATNQYTAIYAKATGTAIVSTTSYTYGMSISDNTWTWKVKKGYTVANHVTGTHNGDVDANVAYGKEFVITNTGTGATGTLTYGPITAVAPTTTVDFAYETPLPAITSLTAAGTVPFYIKPAAGKDVGTYTASVEVTSADSGAVKVYTLILIVEEADEFEIEVDTKLWPVSGTEGLGDVTSIVLSDGTNTKNYDASHVANSGKYTFKALDTAKTYTIKVNNVDVPGVSINKNTGSPVVVDLYELKTAHTGAGSDPAPADGYYLVGQGINLTATPTAGNHVKDWTVEASATTNNAWPGLSTVTYVMTAIGTTITVNYEADTTKYKVVLDADGGTLTFKASSNYRDSLFGGAKTATNYEVEEGAAFGVKSAPVTTIANAGDYTITKANNTFGGWQAKDGTISYSFTAAATLATSDTITLTAVWVPDSDLSFADLVVTGVYKHAITAQGPGATAGGTTPYAYAVTNGTTDPIPYNLVLGAADGKITGTPDDVGTEPARVTVTDSVGATKTATYTFIIDKAEVTPKGTLPNEVTIGMAAPDAAAVLAAFNAPPAGKSTAMNGDGTGETDINGTWAVTGWTVPTTPGDYTATLTFTPANGTGSHDKDFDHYKPYTTTVKVTVTGKLITQVNVSVTAPVAPNAPMTLAALRLAGTSTVSADSGAAYGTDWEITDITWTPDDANFAASTSYTVRVYVAVKTGSAYVFDSALTGSEINDAAGLVATTITANDKVAMLSYTYPKSVVAIDVNVPDMVNGYHRGDMQPTVPSGYDYTITEYHWYLKDHANDPAYEVKDDATDPYKTFANGSYYDLVVTIKQGATAFSDALKGWNNADSRTDLAKVNGGVAPEADQTAKQSANNLNLADPDDKITITYSSWTPADKRIVGIYVEGDPGAYYAATDSAAKHHVDTATGHRDDVSFTFGSATNPTYTMKVHPIYEGDSAPTMGVNLASTQYKVGILSTSGTGTFTEVPADFRDYGGRSDSNEWDDASNKGWNNAQLVVQYRTGASTGVLTDYAYAGVTGVLSVTQLEADGITMDSLPTLTYATPGTDTFNNSGATATVTFNSGAPVANTAAGLNYGHWDGTVTGADDHTFSGVTAAAGDNRTTFFYAVDMDDNGKIENGDGSLTKDIELQNPDIVTTAMIGKDLYACYVDVNGNLVYTKAGTLSTGALGVTITDTNGGDAEYGDTLTATPTGGVDPDGYRWEISTDGGTNWTPIPGATGKDYVPGSDDIGKDVRVVAIYGGEEKSSDGKHIEQRTVKFVVSVQDKTYDGDKLNKHTYTADDFTLVSAGTYGGVLPADDGKVTLKLHDTLNVVGTEAGTANEQRPMYAAAAVGSTITWPAVDGTSAAVKTDAAGGYVFEGASKDFYRLPNDDKVTQIAQTDRGTIRQLGSVVHVDVFFQNSPRYGDIVPPNPSNYTDQRETQTIAVDGNTATWYYGAALATFASFDPTAPAGTKVTGTAPTFGAGYYTVVVKVQPKTGYSYVPMNYSAVPETGTTKFNFHFGTSNSVEVVENGKTGAGVTTVGLKEAGGEYYMWYTFPTALVAPAAERIASVNVSAPQPVVGANVATTNTTTIVYAEGTNGTNLTSKVAASDVKWYPGATGGTEITTGTFASGQIYRVEFDLTASDYLYKYHATANHGDNVSFIANGLGPITGVGSSTTGANAVVTRVETTAPGSGTRETRYHMIVTYAALGSDQQQMLSVIVNASSPADGVLKTGPAVADPANYEFTASTDHKWQYWDAGAVTPGWKDASNGNGLTVDSKFKPGYDYRVISTVNLTAPALTKYTVVNYVDNVTPYTRFYQAGEERILNANITFTSLNGNNAVTLIGGEKQMSIPSAGQYKMVNLFSVPPKDVGNVTIRYAEPAIGENPTDGSHSKPTAYYNNAEVNVDNTTGTTWYTGTITTLGSATTANYAAGDYVVEATVTAKDGYAFTATTSFTLNDASGVNGTDTAAIKVTLSDQIGTTGKYKTAKVQYHFHLDDTPVPKIAHVNLSVPQPVADAAVNTLAAKATATQAIDTGNNERKTTLTMGDITWYVGATGTTTIAGANEFQAGTIYRAEFDVTAGATYKYLSITASGDAADVDFIANGVGPADVSITGGITGTGAVTNVKVTASDADTAHVVVTFAALPTGKQINNVTVVWDAPVAAGDYTAAPYNTYKTLNDSATPQVAMTTADTVWYDGGLTSTTATSANFAAGNQYTVQGVIHAQGAFKFKTDTQITINDETLTGNGGTAVNGVKARIVEIDTVANTATVRYTWTLPAVGLTSINDVHSIFTLDPTNSATVQNKGTAPHTVTAVAENNEVDTRWYTGFDAAAFQADPTNKGTQAAAFAAGNVYTAITTVKPNPTYQYTDATRFYFDFPNLGNIPLGNRGTVTATQGVFTATDGNTYMYYTFPAIAKVVGSVTASSGFFGGPYYAQTFDRTVSHNGTKGLGNTGMLPNTNDHDSTPGGMNGIGFTFRYVVNSITVTYTHDPATTVKIDATGVDEWTITSTTAPNPAVVTVVEKTGADAYTTTVNGGTPVTNQTSAQIRDLIQDIDVLRNAKVQVAGVALENGYEFTQATLDATRFNNQPVYAVTANGVAAPAKLQHETTLLALEDGNLQVYELAVDPTLTATVTGLNLVYGTGANFDPTGISGVTATFNTGDPVAPAAGYPVANAATTLAESNDATHYYFQLDDGTMIYPGVTPLTNAMSNHTLYLRYKDVNDHVAQLALGTLVVGIVNWTEVKATVETPVADTVINTNQITILADQPYQITVGGNANYKWQHKALISTGVWDTNWTDVTNPAEKFVAGDKYRAVVRVNIKPEYAGLFRFSAADTKGYVRVDDGAYVEAVDGTTDPAKLFYTDAPAVTTTGYPTYVELMQEFIVAKQQVVVHVKSLTPAELGTGHVGLSLKGSVGIADAYNAVDSTIYNLNVHWYTDNTYATEIADGDIQPNTWYYLVAEATMIPAAKDRYEFSTERDHYLWVDNANTANLIADADPGIQVDNGGGYGVPVGNGSDGTWRAVWKARYVAAAGLRDPMVEIVRTDDNTILGIELGRTPADYMARSSNNSVSFIKTKADPADPWEVYAGLAGEVQDVTWYEGTWPNATPMADTTAFEIADPGTSTTVNKSYTVKIHVSSDSGDARAEDYKDGNGLFFDYVNNMGVGGVIRPEDVVADTTENGAEKDMFKLWDDGELYVIHTFTLSKTFVHTVTPGPTVYVPTGGGGGTTTVTKEVEVENPVVYYAVGEEGTTPDLTAEKVEKGSKPSSVPKITPVQFMKFVGWSTVEPKAGTTSKLVDPKTVTIEEDTTFYAVYETISIENADHGNYIIGFPNGTFGPDNYITRAQVATIVARACLKDFVEGKDYGNPGNYTDASYHWAFSAISYCAMHGVMNGYLEDDGTYTFRPERYITRQELANVVARLKGIQANQGLSFTDTAQIAEWALNGVYTTVANGWVDGYREDDGTYTFRPERNITRAETVKIFNGYLERGVDRVGLEGLKQYVHTGVASNNTENGMDEYMIWPDCLNHWAYYEIIEAANNHDFHPQDADDASSLEDWDRVYIDEVWRYFDDSSDGADAVDRNNAAEEAARQAAAQATAEEAARQAAAQAAAEEAARQAAAQAAAEEAARQAAAQQQTAETGTTTQNDQTVSGSDNGASSAEQTAGTTGSDTAAADQSGTGNQTAAEESTEVTVTYVVKNNGTVYASMTETVTKGGQPASVPQAVPNEGYTFVGWSDVDPDTGLYNLVTPSQVTVTADTTFYAVFQATTTSTAGTN